MHFTEVDQFCGRKETLELLKKRVLDLKDGYRQNIAFIGGRFLGKTAVLKKFLAELDDSALIPVYLDCENKDFEYFYFKMIGSLLYSYCASSGLPVQEDLALLLAGVQDALPQTTEHIKKIQTLKAHEKISEAYVELIALPQIFAKEAEKFCVLIFDEFQELAEWGIADIYQELGKSIMTQKRCLYIMASSYPGQAATIVTEKLSLLFGNFEVVAVEAFDSMSSQSFIRQLFGALKINPQLVQFLVDFTGGHPLYLRLICEEIRDLAVLHNQKEIFPPLVTQALENVLFDRWGVLNRHFDLTVGKLSAGKGNRVCTGILLALSEHKQNIKELAQGLSLKQAQLSGKLTRLMEEEIIAKNGRYYYIKDKLLRYWLKYVFERKTLSLDWDSSRQTTAFRQEITAAVAAFGHSAEKDLASRVTELLCCFEDDSFQMNNRRYKLPLFQKITPAKVRLAAGGDFEFLRAATEEGEWCIVLCRERIRESDVAEIAKQSRALSGKMQRCILISLHSLDENTRIKALQERMWIWHEGELNTLLNFYNKPFIVATES